jgi:hypothetical protein
MAQNAEKFGDDFLVSEGQRAMSGTFAVAQRLSASGEINTFISKCIGLASADLFSARLYGFTAVDRQNNKVLVNFDHVDVSVLQGAFVERMHRLYGPNVNVAALDAATVSVRAFSVWSSINGAERDNEISFWERYIGQNRRRLAEAFDLIAPKGTFWTKDSIAFIDQMTPSAMLSRMYTDLAQDEALEQRHEEALIRLRKFLDGELKEGEIL